MSLEFSKLLTEVEAMGEALAVRARELSEILPEARAALERIGLADDELREKIEKAGKVWRAAIPSHEPVGQIHPCPPHPSRATIVCSDGSQVYPDRHGSTLYFVINVGSIVYQHGTDETPSCLSTPQVFYEEKDLYGDSDGLVPEALINGRRDTAELSELAALAESNKEFPTFALVDNSLILWLAKQVGDAQRYDRRLDEILKAYLDQLDRISNSGACVAGFIDRSASNEVMRLLTLETLSLEGINEESLKASRFRRLADRTLLGNLLPPGGRSSLFINPSPVNPEYKARGHEMYFFYLNCGRPGKDEITRVEVPQWVALDADRLNFVHAALVEQCRVPDGFPYVLVRAHELAVVTMEERRAFDEMVQGALIRRGLSSAISRKAQTKQWTGARRRHRL